MIRQSFGDRVGPVSVVPPIIVSNGSDCTFFRSTAAATAAGIPLGASIFDAQGQRLTHETGRLVPIVGEGADELAGLLRDWLGYMDAIRESTQFWSLSLLVRASVDHLGYTD